VRAGRTRLATAALAVVALGSWPATARSRAEDAAARLAREVAAVEERIGAAERAATVPEEPREARAQRRFEDGARQYALGDWLHASLMLTDAVDEPSWASAADRPRANFLLADALRRNGLCGAARVRYAEILRRKDAPERAEAVSGALDCAVKEHRVDDVEWLLSEAGRTFRAGPPPQEVLYLAAKGAYQRHDLPLEERAARASAAFEKVGPPFQLQAWYFQGVLRIEQGNLHGSLEWFERCAKAKPDGERDVEVRELCVLALGRVHSQMGDPAAALGWYATMPWASPRFGEAMYETALAHVRAKQWEDALRMTSFIPELSPDSPLAPEATVLRGHLLLRLGRYAEATEAYNVVINTYAPVRDEIDAILTTRGDPVRYYDELIGRQGNAFDVSSVLPPIAVRWATTNREVAVALGLVRAIEGGRADLREAGDLADRLEALLKRGGGVDAFPTLQRAYAQAQAAGNAAARAEGAWIGEVSAAVERGLPPERRGEVARAREARAAVEARFDRLPRSAQDVEDRRVRLRGRVDEVGRSVYQLRDVIDGNLAAIAGVEDWLDKHRAELVSDAEGRQEFTDELRRHRAVIDGYRAELAALRQELAKVRDAAGGVEAMAEESRLRAEYLAAAERERSTAEAARGTILPEDRAVVDGLEGARARLAAVRERATALEGRVAAEAGRRADALRARVEAERKDLVAQTGALDEVQQGSRDLLGQIAVRSIADVRAQFYRLVLKADVGIVDVAWSRKRVRLEKIQTLAVQKDGEVEQLDREYRSLLREVE
jgi:tetratricopeptide (TPR) repeat protein